MISKATQRDIISLKELVDEHRRELGFVLRAILLEGVKSRSINVARERNGRTIFGFVHFRHRNDKITKIYQICVRRSFQGVRIGTLLLRSVEAEAFRKGQTHIVLRCPEDLPANVFYRRYGFRRAGIVPGRGRRLVVWEYKLKGPLRQRVGLRQQKVRGR